MRLLRATALFALLTFATPAVSEARPSLIGPYFSARFEVTKLPYAFGQAASWTDDGGVLSAQNDTAGITQIYRARLDGSRQLCLTCTTVKGPNGLPQERPEGDWILFESFGQQPTHIGGPGLGGYGGDLYVMRPDGSHVYRLTTNSDPDHGAPVHAATGTPYDNFHAYWSPDGRHVDLDPHRGQPALQGGQTWEILLGDFTSGTACRRCRKVRVVGPPYGAYETQPWSPDGKGFLFFAAGGHRSPYQADPARLGQRARLLHAPVRNGRLTRAPARHPDRRQRAVLRGAVDLHPGHEDGDHDDQPWRDAGLVVRPDRRRGPAHRIRRAATPVPPRRSSSWPTSTGRDFSSDLFAVD